ncbi:MAG TPA: hypothetical protein VFX97_16525 [Pyrinomonadaceae bacterium]|nr:hypothetical protein [Pyrinomonadaceae bacterium]
MTIEEVLESLPNGLHDAYLRSINIDYAERTAELQLDIWIGDMSLDEEAREARRQVLLKLSGLCYFVVEAPDPKYTFHEAKPLWIDAGGESPATEGSTKLPETPEGAFTFWMFVHDWNAFIHVAAMQAAVESSLRA